MFRGLNIQRNKILAPYTTYQIGGLADYFFEAYNKKDLVQAIIEARENEIPYFILGTGANILIGDNGFRGLIIRNLSNMVSINNEYITAESGTRMTQLISIAGSNELSGFEHFAGIPSTVGGALWQNLHFLSPDRSKTVFIEDILESAEILDESNIINKVKKDFFKFGYDYSILHDRKLIVVEATFHLERKDKNLIKKQIEENLKWRNERHPLLENYPSCGSVFKKIEGVGAGRLIDEAGLKGYQIGGAKVSEKHANFIVNTGNATAQDVLSVIKLAQEKVFEQTGCKLETEIGFVGEFK